MSRNSEAVDVVDISRGSLDGASAIQIEMTSPQTGLRNRGKQRPDGLEHLSSEGIVNDQAANMENLRLIAASLMTLDVWALGTFGHSCTSSPQLVGRGLYEELRRGILEYVYSFVDLGSNYETRFEIDVQDELRTFSDAEIIKLLGDLSTSKYYAQFIQLRTLLYSTVATEYKYALSAPDLTIPEEHALMKTPQEYLKHLTIEVNEEKANLRAVVSGVWTLRKRIKIAAERNELTPTILGALKEKMIALQLNFHDACIEADYAILPLIDQSKAEWWDPDGKKDKETPPLHAASSYPKSKSVNAILVFLVPSVCLLSCIPAALAWTHTSSQHGSYSDGNFYQLLSSSAMQLLGTGTLVWPTVFTGRLTGLPRILAWVLAGTSIACTVISLPLYLYAPTAWSGLLSFCGNLAQTLVLLQLVYSL